MPQNDMFGAAGVTTTGSGSSATTTTPGGLAANGPIGGTRVRLSPGTLAAAKALTDLVHGDVFWLPKLCVPVVQPLTGALAGATSTTLQTAGTGSGGWAIYLDPAQSPATINQKFYVLNTVFVAQE